MDPLVPRLMRSRDDRVIAGVAGGIAEYVRINPVFIRLAFVMLCFAGPGIVLYPMLWIITPGATARQLLTQAAAAGDEQFVQRQRWLGQILLLIGVALMISLVASAPLGRIALPLVLVVAGIWLVLRRRR
jgi:phage shock protein PspC (stress-responsive transcriptional regulator)